jgi:uncharacterized protein YjeT (DUF2065 family)
LGEVGRWPGKKARMDFWQVFPVAVALVFVLEGVLPFISPRRWRAMMIATVASSTMPVFGASALAACSFGVAMLYLVN